MLLVVTDSLICCVVLFLYEADLAALSFGLRDGAGFGADRGIFGRNGCVRYLAVLTWVSGFDIIYALQDEEFDKAHDLNSIPANLGGSRALRVSEILHVLSFIFVLLPVFFMPVCWLYYIGVAFYAGLLIYQHRIVSPTDLSRVDRAFMTTNGVASVVFMCFYLLDAFVRGV